MSKAPNGKSLELRTNANDENGKAANRGRLYSVKGLLGADVNSLYEINYFWVKILFIFVMLCSDDVRI